MLINHQIENYKTYSGALYPKLNVSYQIFGKELHTAPIVLVNHALTGNSDVASKKNGWWKEIIGPEKVVNTADYTIIAFNIVGNGYDGHLIDNYKDFTTQDIARIYFQVLSELKVAALFAIIGGSLGGGIAWEMVSLYPNFAQYIIPIAADWKATDWIIGHNTIQGSILLNSKTPLQDARKMAMLFYRTPQSFTRKFNRTKTEDGEVFNVESWLNHHGNVLTKRFELKAYLMMNHLLTTVDITRHNQSIRDVLEHIQSKIIQIGIDSDLFFIPDENIKTKQLLDELNIPNEYHEVKSEDGHDAFLIENEQLTKFLTPIFKQP
ncbi:alpha/beta fold hydrolase [Crocinitomix catalasitica]|uniref:alpha/beta fold hydrolase n=1 Tax=Crocinitomix catalasitica TaxID=184607 RepID=UPI0006872566|nr:alpha/beta fold hydrolase [Crocinitomix catalasitica]